jgi:uncharacterized protein (TIGR00251 family)
MKIAVHVQPRASRNAVLGWKEGALKVALTAPPVEGAANEALVLLLAEAFGLKRRQVGVVAGLQSRRKTVELSGIDAATEAKIRSLGN